MKQVSNSLSVDNPHQHTSQPPKQRRIPLLAGTLAITLALCLAAITTKVAAIESDIALPADISFDVWMDDRPLGSHDYRFSRKGDLLQVDSSARFNLKVLFVNVFRYNHDARELWQGPCLTALNSDTTTNGEQETLELLFSVDECAGTYAYWDRARLERPELTNAQTGKKEQALWSEPDAAPLPKPGKKKNNIPALTGLTHYQLTTDSATFLLWYDKQGRCLAMQTTNDGRTITYMNRVLD